MPYLSFSKEVDVEIDYDDFDVDDLAKVLVTEKNYKAALDKALSTEETFRSEFDEDDDVKELVSAFRCGKSVELIISNIAYSRYGMVC